MTKPIKVFIDESIDNKLLTETEYEDVVLALAEARPGLDITDDESKKVIDWATQARLNAELLNQILCGDMLMDINDNGELVFRLSEQGKLVAKEELKLRRKKQ